MWSTPLQGTGSESASFMVCGVAEVQSLAARPPRWRTCRRACSTCCRDLSTGTSCPFLPVAGSISVRLLPRSLSTQSVLRSYDGTTCWGCLPTAKCADDFVVAGSMNPRYCCRCWARRLGGEVAHHRAEFSCMVGGVDIGRVLHRRHAGQEVGLFRGLFRGLSFRFGFPPGAGRKAGQRKSDRDREDRITAFHPACSIANGQIFPARRVYTFTVRYEEESRIIQKIVHKAWMDDVFRHMLLSDPARVLRTEGVNIPRGVEVRVVEDTEHVHHVVLPMKPSVQELSETQFQAHGRPA